MSEDGSFCLLVEGEAVEGTLLAPAKLIPGVLFIHGWDGRQENDLECARRIARLGCLSFTLDLRGHAEDKPQRNSVTRRQNLEDVLAAYDFLAAQPSVDRSAVAVIGSSYGAYLAAILTAHRPVNWLGLRVPALYPDEGWDIPKESLDKEEIAAYRRSVSPADPNRAVQACSRFRGDALVVESELDDVIPPQTIMAYRLALAEARSLTYRMMAGADHGLTSRRCHRDYDDLLVNWLGELVQVARTV